MAADPKIRASDDDRERAVTLLREHHAAGRLTVEEFNERIDQAYAARTVGELDELLADLPAIDLYRLPDAGLAPHQRRSGPSAASHAELLRTGAAVARPGRFSPVWAGAWGSWLSVSLVCFVIWAASGASGFPWPVWVAGPLGALLLGRWITGGHPHGDGN
jgi:hypothetical protein